MHPVALTMSSNSAFNKLSSGSSNSEVNKSENTEERRQSSSPSPQNVPQKQVLKFSVDSIISEKCTVSDNQRENNDSPNSVSSEESLQESRTTPGPFSMDGILSKHQNIIRNSEKPRTSSSLLSHINSENRWSGFYTAASFPWIPGSSLSPTKSKIIFTFCQIIKNMRFYLNKISYYLIKCFKVKMCYSFQHSLLNIKIQGIDFYI